MEIHPPEKPIHTVKDFLLQLTTITIGILIALSLEAAVEWSHHRTLVSEAKENLSREILNNRAEAEKILSAIPKLRANEEKALQFIDDLRGHRLQNRNEKGVLDFSYYLGLMSSTGWSTAQASGAVTHMSYPDVQKYADLYDLQRKFDGLQDRFVEDLIAATPSDDPDNASPRELQEWRHRVQTSLTSLKNLEGLARTLKDDYDRALR
jgi:hypothetical protein